jgi:hypothetical protein
MDWSDSEAVEREEAVDLPVAGRGALLVGDALVEGRLSGMIESKECHEEALIKHGFGDDVRGEIALLRTVKDRGAATMAMTWSRQLS